MNSRKYWQPDLYTKAWNFASYAHQGQKLPGTELPYINHLGNVAMEVIFTISQSNDEIEDPDLAVQCALLHDVIEDTPVTYREVKEFFGLEVANGVMALSKDRNLPTKSEQMEDSLARILLQPQEIWLVKLADRITNLQPPPKYWNYQKKVNYQNEARQIHQALHSANQILSERLLNKINLYSQYL